MLDIIVFIRNAVLIAVMAWLGLQAAPTDNEQDRESAAPSAIASLLR